MGYELGFEDAFTEYTLVVDWEQKLSARRLRSVHVFGAADHEVTAKLTVLPAAAQIQDVAEGGVQASEVANTESAPSPSGEEDTPVTDEWWFWLLVIGLPVVALLVYYREQVSEFLTQCCGSQSGLAQLGSLSLNERPDRKVYNKVRRSERFTLSNF